MTNIRINTTCVSCEATIRYDLGEHGHVDVVNHSLTICCWCYHADAPAETRCMPMPLAAIVAHGAPPALQPGSGLEE